MVYGGLDRAATAERAICRVRQQFGVRLCTPSCAARCWRPAAHSALICSPMCFCSSSWVRVAFSPQPFSSQIVYLNQSAGYAGDWLGLRTLDTTGRLHVHTTACPHTEYTKAPYAHARTHAATCHMSSVSILILRALLPQVSKILHSVHIAIFNIERRENQWIVVPSPWRGVAVSVQRHVTLESQRKEQ